MDPQQPDSFSSDLHLLFNTLLEVGRERDEVHAALSRLRDVLNGELCQAGVGTGLAQRTLTPQPRRRDAEGADATPLSGVGAVSLEMIVERARWKADACRMALKRSSSAASDDDSQALVIEENLLRTRREPLEDCYAWMLDSPRPLPKDRFLEEVALCYEVVARAAELCIELADEGLLAPVPSPDLLFLLAEAQSSLLTALAHCDLRGDSDQRDLFLWLKDQTTRHRVYVDRHMRLDDPADSSKANELLERLETVAAQMRAKKGGADVSQQESEDSPAGRSDSTHVLANEGVLILGPQTLKPTSADWAADLGASVVRWIDSSDVDGWGELLQTELTRTDIRIVFLVDRLPQADYAAFKQLCTNTDKRFVRMTVPEGQVLTPADFLREGERQIGVHAQAKHAK